MATAQRFRPTWRMRLPYGPRSLLQRWRSTLGMIVGVGIALGLGMTLLGTTNATMELITGDFRVSEADLYVVQEGGTLIPLLPGESPGAIEHARGVIGQIRAMPAVRSAVGAMSWTMEREYERARRRDDPTELITVMGIDGDPAAMGGMLNLRQGRWLARADEIVLGWKLASEKGLGVGDRLRLNGRDFRVVGIARLRGFGLNTDALAYLDYPAFRQRAGLGDVFNVIAVDTGDLPATRRRIEQLESVTVSDFEDIVKLAEKAMETDMVSHWTLITLTLTIAGLFVSSILSQAVLERRLDFATLRAIGLPTRAILLNVASEALVVCLAAWVFGIGVSSLLGTMINVFMAPAYNFEYLYSVSPQLFGLVLALALGLGLVAGWFPARQASRVEPVEVLREA
jgi:ABC-type antimicrobial peptide transport system permease subunit